MNRLHQARPARLTSDIRHPIPLHFEGPDNDADVMPSPTSSNSSVDEDELNQRVAPFWSTYRSMFELRGFRLDTVRDVKMVYGQHAAMGPFGSLSTNYPSRHGDAVQEDEDALCPDAGLPENLFRGTRIFDGKRIMVKAVHARSREYQVIRVLSSPPLRNDPMNHTIPVLDLFEVLNDDVAFIVMEEWSSQLMIDSGCCCLVRFLTGLRQCLEHILFMHQHGFAHLDISLRNIVTNPQGRYAYIDYETSRQFDGTSRPLVYGYRGTEVPPECEKGSGIDPFKVDVWALAVLTLRACKLSGYWVPELMRLITPMLDEDPNRRPTLCVVLPAFDQVVAGVRRYLADCHCHTH